MKKINLTSFSLFLLLLLLTVLVNCTPSTLSGVESPVENIPAATSDASAEEVVAPPVASYITANSIEDLTDAAELVVIGQVEITDEVVNMARNPDDFSADPNVFVVGQVYQLHVDQYLKGNGPETIMLVQQEGIITSNSNMSVEDQSIERAKEQSEYVPMPSENKYIMFLEPLWGFPDKSYYAAPMQPWRFNISDAETAKPESPWHYADNVFLPQSSANFIEQVVQQINRSN